MLSLFLNSFQYIHKQFFDSVLYLAAR